jgi:predicted MFS family arabinose efflux permease
LRHPAAILPDVRLRHLLITLAAGLALADASVVTLALPDLLVDLHTTVEGVAAVIGVYTIVLALALIPAERLMRRVGAARVGRAGLLLFALASLACAASNSLALLLIARAFQAAGGAAALVSAFAQLATHTNARRLWLGAAVLASAIGPALGGALTQAFDWRAIFLVQAPIAALAAIRNEGTVPPVRIRNEGTVPSVRAAVALGLLSAALSAVLFLLVLMLVAGWSEAPLRAAVAVTMIPAGALVGSRVGGPLERRAAAGCLLVGGGILALALLPESKLGWTLAPQALAGAGMGMALPSLAGGLLPERDSGDAARLLTIRHLGIAAALAVLAPVVSHDLDQATQRARERGVALVLDARLNPVEKVRLAPALLKGVEARNPRHGLRTAVAAHRSDVQPDERATYDRLGERADETLTSAVADAFRTAFIVTGALALIAALLLVLPPPPLALGAAAATIAAYAILHAAIAPAPVRLQDPCKGRNLPGSGGITGFLQDRALELLDSTACRLHASREELVLALADEQDRKRFIKRHGVDPRSPASVLGGLLGG